MWWMFSILLNVIQQIKSLQKSGGYETVGKWRGRYRMTRQGTKTNPKNMSYPWNEMHCSNSTMENEMERLGNRDVDFAAIAEENKRYLISQRIQSTGVLRKSGNEGIMEAAKGRHLSQNDLYTQTIILMNEMSTAIVHNIRRHCNNCNSYFCAYLVSDGIWMGYVKICMIYITVFQLSNYWGFFCLTRLVFVCMQKNSIQINWNVKIYRRRFVWPIPTFVSVSLLLWNSDGFFPVWSLNFDEIHSRFIAARGV